jgi:hypothetical protein
MDWYEQIAVVEPYVVRIETPGGHGTGFLCVWAEDKQFCGIATAYHVVQHADRWREPIQIVHTGAPSEPRFLASNERVIFTVPEGDVAIIAFNPEHLQLPDDLLPLVPPEQWAKPGVEVGWLGYPAVAPQTLSFFSGHVSAKLDEEYLIDGVAINGVSGGPVFFHNAVHGQLFIIGAISAYIPNTATGTTLPGLAYARGVSKLHDTIAQIKSIEDAREQKEMVEKEFSAGANIIEPGTHIDTGSKHTR